MFVLFYEAFDNKQAMLNKIHEKIHNMFRHFVTSSSGDYYI